MKLRTKWGEALRPGRILRGVTRLLPQIRGMTLGKEKPGRANSTRNKGTLLEYSPIRPSHSPNSGLPSLQSSPRRKLQVRHTPSVLDSTHRKTLSTTQVDSLPPEKQGTICESRNVIQTPSSIKDSDADLRPLIDEELISYCERQLSSSLGPRVLSPTPDSTNPSVRNYFRRSLFRYELGKWRDIAAPEITSTPPLGRPQRSSSITSTPLSQPTQPRLIRTKRQIINRKHRK